MTGNFHTKSLALAQFSQLLWLMGKSREWQPHAKSPKARTYLIDAQKQRSEVQKRCHSTLRAIRHTLTYDVIRHTAWQGEVV